MNPSSKIQTTHLRRLACIYVRQSTASQVVVNRESTDRQYRLVERAALLGWSNTQILVIDEDLGQSGATTHDRRGFDRMVAQVALGQIGLILSIEVSRVARNNADWYRLLDLCGVTDTLIGDEDGLYHAGLFNDRLLLGLKGTMAEAELHVLRARLNGGIRNKAARGELRRGLPVGFVWGDLDGEVRFHPDQAVTGALRTLFEKFAELGSARQVWLWFRSEAVQFPHATPAGQIQWVSPTYTAIHNVLSNPVYAGAYAYGKTRYERFVDDAGHLRRRLRHLPRSEWAVLIPQHHPGFIDWDTFLMNERRLARNTRPATHQAGGAPREGSALLQGLVSCGRCGRRLHVYYQGQHSTPGYYCPNSNAVNGRGVWCLRIGGVRLQDAVVAAFLDALSPAGLDAAIEAETILGLRDEAATSQWKLQVERARYEAERAERRFRAVEPENRLVARTLEAEWERRLAELQNAETELQRRLPENPVSLTEEQRRQIRSLGEDIRGVWTLSTTTDRDRKELLQCLLEDVQVRPFTEENRARIILRWRGGALGELDIPLKTRRIPPLRTDDQIIDLVRRLAVHHRDDVIAGILNRQGHRTVRGERFTAPQVGNLRRYWKIPCYSPPTTPPEGELLTIKKAADRLGIGTSTLHRWLMDGFIPGEQETPGAPWRIRLTDEIRALFVTDAPPGYVPMPEAMRRLGVSRQTVMQRVKRGELPAVHVKRGRQKGLLIKVLDNQPTLFAPTA